MQSRTDNKVKTNVQTPAINGIQGLSKPLTLVLWYCWKEDLKIKRCGSLGTKMLKDPERSLAIGEDLQAWSQSQLKRNMEMVIDSPERLVAIEENEAK